MRWPIFVSLAVALPALAQDRQYANKLAPYVASPVRVIDRMLDLAKVKPGETTEDGNMSFLTARCLGSCGLAPAVVFDGAVAGKQNADQSIDRVKRMIEDPFDSAQGHGERARRVES